MVSRKRALKPPPTPPYYGCDIPQPATRTQINAWVAKYGANGVVTVPYATGDRAAAIQTAEATAQAAGKALLIKGLQQYATHLTINVPMFGESWSDGLQATVVNERSIYHAGSNLSLFNMRLTTSNTTAREDGNNSELVRYENSPDYYFAHNKVEFNGIISYGGAHRAIVEYNYFIKNNKDVIHHTSNNYDVIIRYNYIDSMDLLSGDDAIALINYSTGGGAKNRRFQIYNNTIKGHRNGRGIATMGCDRVHIHHNYIRDTGFAGILGGMDGSPWFTTHGVNMLIEDNLIDSCGIGWAAFSVPSAHANITFFCATGVTQDWPVTNVVFRRNVSKDPGRDHFRMWNGLFAWGQIYDHTMIGGDEQKVYFLDELDGPILWMTRSGSAGDVTKGNSASATAVIDPAAPVQIVNDTFTRTVALNSGAGTCESPALGWSANVNTPTGVDGTAWYMTTPAANFNDHRWVFLGGGYAVPGQNQEVLARVEQADWTYHGFSVVLRCAGASNSQYLLGWKANVASDKRWRIARMVSAAVTDNLATTSPTPTSEIPLDGEIWWLRARVIGTGAQVTLLLKYWKDGTNEPFMFQLSYVDTAGARLTTSSTVGFYCQAEANPAGSTVKLHQITYYTLP